MAVNFLKNRATIAPLWVAFLSLLATGIIWYTNPVNQKLRKLFDPTALSWPLIEAAHSFTPQDVSAIPRLLRTIEYDDSKRRVPISAQQYSEPQFINRSMAIEAMGRIDPQNARLHELLAQMLHSNDTEKRCVAAVHLASVDRRALLPDLILMLKATNPRERVYAALALSRMQAEATPAVSSLVRVLCRDDSAGPRAWAARALSSILPQDINAFAALIRGMSDKDQNVRVVSAGALSALSDRIPRRW